MQMTTRNARRAPARTGAIGRGRTRLAGDSLAFASISEVAPMVRTGTVSPVALTEAVLERSRRLAGKLNAYIELYEESALLAAREAERQIAAGQYLGPLHGIPIGLKDLVDIAGKVTTGGTKILRGNVARADATITKRLRAAGAVITGKLCMVEFAMGATGLNPHYGNTPNPWNLERVPCGSSSGSASAVASGLVAGAIGSDTGGSIRMPAAVCGIVGLKPTYGRVSRHGVLDLSWSCDHVGPMTRTVGDTAHMMNAIAGFDPADPASSREPSPDYTAGLGAGARGVRVGVPEHYFFDDVDSEVEGAVRAAIEALERAGAEVKRVPMPWVSVGRAINMRVLMPEAVAVHEKWIGTRPQDYSAEVRARLMADITTPAIEYIRAQRARRWFCQQMAEAMDDVDVLITPSVPTQTPTIKACTPAPGENEAADGLRLATFTGVFNTTGQPSMSVPCGFTKDGMPIGMMISGKPFDEVTVLRVGAAYESMTGWSQMHPEL
jgi:Asp-tRNA(Asn)/Glu-tRNA(Gln) amidotransferase A subunit family amidase